MIQKSYKTLCVINYVIAFISELSNYTISETDWKSAQEVRSFLELKAIAMENQSSSIYITLSPKIGNFPNVAHYLQNVTSKHDVLTNVATNMKPKLARYDRVVQKSLLNFACTGNPTSKMILFSMPLFWVCTFTFGHKLRCPSCMVQKHYQSSPASTRYTTKITWNSWETIRLYGFYEQPLLTGKEYILFNVGKVIKIDFPTLP